jgi:hypothetical protein
MWVLGEVGNVYAFVVLGRGIMGGVDKTMMVRRQVSQGVNVGHGKAYRAAREIIEIYQWRKPVKGR